MAAPQEQQQQQARQAWASTAPCQPLCSPLHSTHQAQGHKTPLQAAALALLAGVTQGLAAGGGVVGGTGGVVAARCWGRS